MAGNHCYEKNKGSGQHDVNVPSILSKWHVSSPSPPRLVASHFAWLPFLLSCSWVQHGKLTKNAELSHYSFLEFLPCLQNNGEMDLGGWHKRYSNIKLQS
jgi:hypothetical protein